MVSWPAHHFQERQMVRSKLINSNHYMPPPQVYGQPLPQDSIAGSGSLQPGNRTPHTTYPSGGLPGTATTTRSWSRHQCNCVVLYFMRNIYDLMRNSVRLSEVDSVSIFLLFITIIISCFYHIIRITIIINHRFYSLYFTIIIIHL